MQAAKTVRCPKAPRGLTDFRQIRSFYGERIATPVCGLARNDMGGTIPGAIRMCWGGLVFDVIARSGSDVAIRISCAGSVFGGRKKRDGLPHQSADWFAMTWGDGLPHQCAHWFAMTWGNGLPRQSADWLAMTVFRQSKQPAGPGGLLSVSKKPMFGDTDSPGRYEIIEECLPPASIDILIRCGSHHPRNDIGFFDRFSTNPELLWRTDCHTSLRTGSQ